MKNQAERRPRIVVTTDVNGTTTPDNTFGELVRADGLFDEMDKLMRSYTAEGSKFSRVLPKMATLVSCVDRGRVEAYAKEMPLYAGVTATLDELIESENIDAKVALSTTGFAGLMVLVNKFRHGFLLSVAASPVLGHLLSGEERACLIRPITDEKEKVRVIDDMANSHKPDSNLVFHIGDTMGDFLPIRHAAELGGIGVAFDPNEALAANISRLSKNLRTKISQVEFPTGEKPDFARAGEVIKEAVWKTLRTEL